MKRSKERKTVKKMVHVSFDLVDRFVPRVPVQRSPGEDAETPRICVAPDLISALQAIPQAGETLLNMQRCKLPLIIHAYYLESCNVLSSEEIKTKVGDAEATGEMWIMEEPKNVRRIDYEITDFFSAVKKDCFGTTGRFVVCISTKRVKYQSNWENLANSVSDNPANAKWFLTNRPKDITFRTFASNLDEEMIKRINELRGNSDEEKE